MLRLHNNWLYPCPKTMTCDDRAFSITTFIVGTIDIRLTKTLHRLRVCNHTYLFKQVDPES